MFLEISSIYMKIKYLDINWQDVGGVLKYEFVMLRFHANHTRSSLHLFALACI